MTVAFINLPWFFADTNGVLRRGIRCGSRWPFSVAASAAPGSANVRIGEYLPFPWLMASSAGWVQRAFPDAKVVLRDSIARYESIAEFNDWWCETAPDIVILETGTPCWENDLKFIKAMKHSNPKVLIAVGGPPARELSATVEPGIVDAWLLGEMEKPAARFANGERGVIGFDLLTREELHKAPFPIFDEPVAHHYADSNPHVRGNSHPWPELTVWASRGCRFVCSFCSLPATMTNDDPLGKGGRKIRFYDYGWLKDFIRERISVAAKTGRPLQSVRFDGDMENAGDKHTLEVCKVMRGIGLPWSMMCRADTVSQDVWREMRLSGCFGVKVGFESASSRIVNEIVGKKLDLKAAEETCRFLRNIGLEVHSTWMLGNRTETQEERQLTLATIRRFYVENVHSSHQLSGAATIAGTPLANTPNHDPNFIVDGDGQRKAETLLAK